MRSAALSGLLLLVAGSLATAQRPPQRTLPRPIDFSAGQDDNLFSVLRSQDHIHAFETALTELDAGEHRAAVERLHQLLQADHGGVVPVAPGRFLGLRLAVITTMANLPAAAAEAYESLVGREVGSLGDDLLQQPPEQLRLLAERFPCAAIGRRARLRLGDLALVAGDAGTAVGHFRAALDASTIGSAEERRVAERLQIAAVLLDPATARADHAEGRLLPPGPAALSALPPTADRTGWEAYGGGRSGRTPMPTPAGRPRQHWSADVRAPEFDRRDIGNLAMHATGDLDTVFVNTGREVLALDPLRGAISWQSPTPLIGNGREYADSTNQDLVLAPACAGDVLVAALQVPEPSMNVDFSGGFRIMSKIPQRRLFAYSRSSGEWKPLWAHYDDLDGPRTRRFRGHDACANPLIAGNSVYLPIHDRSGAIAFSIAAYDLRTGQQQWRRLVCSSQQDVNMFGNARTEFASSPLCLHDGLLFGASNLGTAFAIEAWSGRIRWITSYEVTRMPRALLSGQTERQVYFANNAPVVADHVLCTTPIDSQFVLGLDTESGQTLWRLPAEASVDGVDNRVLWLAGALDDEFVLAGAGCVAVKARPEVVLGERATVRQLIRPDQLGDRRMAKLPGRPAVTADQVWVPRADQIVVIDRAGNLVGDSPIALPRYQPGNLLLCGGIVVSVRQRAFEVLFDGDALLARVQQALTADPEDPAAILRLANLRQSLVGAETSQGAAAVMDLYRRGLQACDRRGLPAMHPIRQALQTELFDRSLTAAEARVGSSDREARAAFGAARDLAPDVARWIDVQARVLTLCGDDRGARAEELQRLLQRAGDGIFPLGDGIPVPVYVLWQRAAIADQPATAVALWQQLLEQHGEQQLDSGTAAAAATAAIARLIERHGPACYAAVAARAEAALVAAADDRARLVAVASTWPNSAAAATARSRLLDNAVRAGDLAAACTVLAQATANGAVPPGVLRRVMVAADKRQNQGLAAAMATRLRPFATAVSDWPEDRGATYATLMAERAPIAVGAEPPLSVPGQVIARILPTSPREFVRPLPRHLGRGFELLPDAPLYVLAAGELRAIDVHAAGEQKPVLFTLPVEYVEHVALCGDTLVVPDTSRLFGVDARNGQLRWQLPNPRNRLYEFSGIEHGVLHVWRMPTTAIGGNELIGVEPLSGTLLFTLPVDGDELQPKGVPGGLLHLRLGADGRNEVYRLDAITAAVTTTFPLPPGLVGGPLAGAAGSITSRFYPQWLAASEDRLFLPLDHENRPQLLAIGADGAVAWQWQGGVDHQLLMAAHRDDRLVIVTMPAQGNARAVLLRADNGAVLQEIDAGHEPTVLNWERSWFANPAPPMLAIDSHADATRRQRQLLCLGVAADRSTFVVELGPDTGEIVPAPQFGPDFVTFATLPARDNGGPRLFALSLADRSGRLPNGRKSMRLDLAGGGDGMTTASSYTVIASGQGLLLLGTPAETK